MSTTPPEATRTLADYESFLRFLASAAVPYTVIGGCAVGAYARFRGLELFSGDLDLYATPEDLHRVVDLVRRNGVAIRNRPRPRSVPVAVFDWESKPVNVLCETVGLPEPLRVLAAAREFKLRKSGNFSVPVADPYDLLANKLAVNRPKDRPHIAVLNAGFQRKVTSFRKHLVTYLWVAVLMAFIEEEIVEVFLKETLPRPRLLPARRYLDVTGDRALPEALAARLVPLARLDTDFRFLADHAPSRRQADELIGRAPARLRDELRSIVTRRRRRR